MRMFFVALLCIPTMLVAEDTKPQVPLSVRVYSVADLVCVSDENGTDQLTQMLLAGSGDEAAYLKVLASAHSTQKSAIKDNLAELKELLQTTTVPEDWEPSGGSGRISTYQKALSLVVRQHEKGHQEICELLEQLRRENNIKVLVTMEAFEDTSRPTSDSQPMVTYGGVVDSPFPYAQTTAANQGGTVPVSFEQPQPATIQGSPANPPSAKPEPIQTMDEVIAQMKAKHGSSMNDAELQEFRAGISGLSRSALRQSATINNGHSAIVSMQCMSKATTVVSSDRRHVDVQFSLGIQGFGPKSLRIPDGETKIFRMGAEDEFITVLLTAEIQVPEEPEELATTPQGK